MEKGHTYELKLPHGMDKRGIEEQLKIVSESLHRIIQLSIDAGARAHHAYLAALTQGAGGIEMAILNLQQERMNINQRAGLVAGGAPPNLIPQ